MRPIQGKRQQKDIGSQGRKRTQSPSILGKEPFITECLPGYGKGRFVVIIEELLPIPHGPTAEAKVQGRQF